MYKMDKKQGEQMITHLAAISSSRQETELTNIKETLSVLLNAFNIHIPKIDDLISPRAYENSVKTLSDQLLTERTERLIQEEAYRYRKRNRRQWFNIRNRFITAFYNEQRASDTALQYNAWMSQDAQFIPKKFIANSKTLDEARKLMEDELDRLEKSVSKYSQQQKEELSKIEGLINRTGGTIRAKLYEIWKEEIETEQNTSREIWSNKKKYLEETEAREKEKSRNLNTNEGKRSQQRNTQTLRRFQSRANLNNLNTQEDTREFPPFNANSFPNRDVFTQYIRPSGVPTESANSQNTPNQNGTGSQNQTQNKSQMEDKIQGLEDMMGHLMSQVHHMNTSRGRDQSRGIGRNTSRGRSNSRGRGSSRGYRGETRGYRGFSRGNRGRGLYRNQNDNNNFLWNNNQSRWDR